MSFVRVSKCTRTTNQVKPSGSGRTRQPSKSDIKVQIWFTKLTACPTKHKLPHRGKTTIFPEELAINNPRQFYSANCSGHGDPFPGNTNTDGLSFTESKQKECLTDRPGGTGNDPTESNQESFSMPRSVSEPCLPCSKERWGSETGNKPISMWSMNISRWKESKP